VTLVDVDVVLVLWPDNSSDLGRLATSGVPRLLLVAPEASPPEDGDCLQDWIRLPADDQDVRARVVALEHRAAMHRAPVTVSEDGRLSYRGQTTWLSPTVRLLFQALANRFGSAVPLETLIRQVWPDDPPTSSSIRVHILRLRRRIAPLGLEIRNIQGKGYVLTPRS
jgi:DNA-binding response OmpR family regulator